MLGIRDGFIYFHSFAMRSSNRHIFLLVCPLFSLCSHCISQILESVNHIHQHDIVHRDLKVSGCPLPWQLYTHARAHTHFCSWPWQHTDGSRFLHLSLSSAFLLLFPLDFFPGTPLPSSLCTLCSSICPCSESVCLWRIHVCSCRAQRWWVMITWWRCSLTYGKEKTRTHTAHTDMNTHTFCIVMKQVYYETEGDGIYKPWRLPGQPIRHHTAHGSAGEGLEISHIADRLKCKVQRKSTSMHSRGLA